MWANGDSPRHNSRFKKDAATVFPNDGKFKLMTFTRNNFQIFTYVLAFISIEKYFKFQFFKKLTKQIKLSKIHNNVLEQFK